MPAIDPDTDEKAEVGTDDNRVEIVKGFRSLDDGINESWNLCVVEEQVLTARKKSLMSCVIYTAMPMYVKWNR